MTSPPAGPDERHRYFHERFTTDTLVFLGELLGFNLDSRQVLARILVDAVYTPLRQGQGPFVTLPPLYGRSLSLLAIPPLLGDRIGGEGPFHRHIKFGQH